MKIIDILKKWLGLAPKPPGPTPEVKTVTLPNGRVAEVDERGNFTGFKS